jgi:hypothetical protein
LQEERIIDHGRFKNVTDCGELQSWTRGQGTSGQHQLAAVAFPVRSGPPGFAAGLSQIRETFNSWICFNRDTRGNGGDAMTAEDKCQLANALNNWRDHFLNYLQGEMSKASEEVRNAEDGLAIANRNPGEVAEDVIETLWERFEKNSILLCRLSRVSDAVQELDLPGLVTLFARTEKIKGYPWEGDGWKLPTGMF